MSGCCLLGVCCPPLMRRKKIAEYFQGFGVEHEASYKIADDVIVRVDAFMNTGLGSFLKQMIQAVKDEPKD